MKKKHLTGLSIALAVVALSGCSPASDAAPPTGEALVAELAAQAKESSWDSQYEILRDGEVTVAEHDAAFRKMTDCMLESGISVSNPAINPADGLTYLYSIDGPGLDEEFFLAEQAACLESEWNLVDNGFLATRQPRMEPALMDAARACLIAQGYEISDNTRAFRDLAGDPDADDGAQRDAAGVCVSEQAHALYPELDQISVTM
ncbi:hypothetical protein [Microbacterium phyllosphaerae]|uniref:hypothetical protein n=1 Tax=Microbacterium phyllosphaerae TaxID=124798 RepID=UPI002166F633|nr:hypothetical protein [Microbacterium phyllosphaerae]MCS3442151.1 hypothetical protein [Microbacterium phyllosphaerae]